MLRSYIFLTYPNTAAQFLAKPKLLQKMEDEPADVFTLPWAKKVSHQLGKECGFQYNSIPYVGVSVYEGFISDLNISDLKWQFRIHIFWSRTQRNYNYLTRLRAHKCDVNRWHLTVTYAGKSTEVTCDGILSDQSETKRFPDHPKCCSSAGFSFSENRQRIPNVSVYAHLCMLLILWTDTFHINI